ncbi:hypothetical protein D3C76_1813680 [compost metagenome]
MNTSNERINARVKNAVSPSHGACRFCLPWPINSPSDALPAGMPKPRKSRAVRVEMAPVRMNGR